MLPSDGSVPVSAVGPTCWWGGAVTDRSSDGGFNVTHAANKFSVCSPVFQVSSQSGAEDAAFNAELFDGPSHSPLVMSGGDTIQVHFHLGSPSQGWNITVTDMTTGHSGTIVLNSKYGPLLPLFGRHRPARP